MGVTDQPFFSKWEAALAVMQALAGPGSAPVHINNPKIPIKYVIHHGTQIWPLKDDAPLPPEVREGLEMAKRLFDNP